MPISPNLQNTVQQALANRILSRGEGEKILRQVRSAEDVAHVVRALQDAYNAPGGLEVQQHSRAANLNWLLAQLDRVAPLPLDRNKAQPAGGGALNWIAALAKAQGPVQPDPVGPGDIGGDPIPAGPVGAPLAKKSFGGQDVAVNAEGGLALGGRALAVDLAGRPSDQVIEALQGLLRPGQLELLAPEVKGKLVDNLLGQVDAAFPADNEAQGKYRRLVGAVAALGAVGEAAATLSGAQVDTLLALYADAPNPLSQALIQRALEEAPKSAAQAEKAQALAAPEGKAELLKAFDDLVSGQARTPGWNRVEGAAVGFTLSALTFSKNQAAVDNVYKGMDVYAGLNPGRGWDAETLGHMQGVLETYVDKYPQTAFVFGTFSEDAPKDVARLTNAKVVKALTPALEAAAPSFDGVPLSADQAKFMKSVLAGIKDDAAVRTFTEALSEAADLLSPKLRGRWDRAEKPQVALTPAAFAQFEQVALRFLEQKDGTKDGMIDARALADAVKAEVGAIKEKLVPRLVELGNGKLGAASLSPEAAGFVKGLLAQHLRSEMSVTNLVEAVEVIAAAHGGRVEGAGLAQLGALVDEYKANWPGRQMFDFNKLGRMARFKVAGQAVPLSTLNGQKVGLAEFYGAVARGVTASFDAGKLAYPWMAERWGMRAKESVELLDVIAQRTAERKGPVAELQAKYGAVTVLATGTPGAHDQFVFEVQGGRRFVTDDKGTLVPYANKPEPVLFTAQIRPDGAFDVKVPAAASRTTRAWPIQTPYAIGDSVDLKFLDPAAVKKWEEGQPFSDEHKLLEARITGFDGKGNYTVSYKKPGGEAVEKQVSLRELVETNNPHHFSIHGSSFSDVSIDVNKDPALKKLLQDAQPIIQQHLPRDGSLLELSPAQVAKRQKACVAALMAHVRGVMKYPAEKEAHPDAASAEYHRIIDGLGYWEKVPLGKLLELGKGVCRHQCVVQHLLMQEAGIDARMASGAANEGDGDYRGLHIWLELSLADNARYLSDQTWNDVAIPLWDGAYDRDKRRIEMFHRTDSYNGQVV
jgi:hypothetical protein